MPRGQEESWDLGQLQVEEAAPWGCQPGFPVPCRKEHSMGAASCFSRPVVSKPPVGPWTSVSSRAVGGGAAVGLSSAIL